MTEREPEAPEENPESDWRPEGGPRWPLLLPVPPRRLPGPEALALALTVVLILSLVANAVLLRRLRGERARVDLRIEALEDRLEALRGRLRGSGTDDPLGAIAAAVERLRGIEFGEPVRPEVLSPADFRERVRALATEGPTRAEVEATGKVLRALRVIPARFDLYEALVDFQEEEVGGFYDPKSKRLVVPAADAKDLSALERMVLAHEYTHALTDQRLGLKDLEELGDEEGDDQASAYQALVEGDAMLTMSLYQTEVLTLAEQLEAAQEVSALPQERLDALPAFIRDALGFPYTRGLEFVTELHGRGGFDLVDRAYRDPPVSTEQILHPSRYLDERDDPTPVRMPDVRRALGAGWKEIDEGGIGELDVTLIADRFLGSLESRRAAAGWDGGEYVGLESRAGVLVAILTAWDSESEAREAAASLARWVPRRFDGRGRAFALEGAQRAWSSGDGAAAVLRDGARVAVLVGPDQASVRRARAAFA